MPRPPRAPAPAGAALTPPAFTPPPGQRAAAGRVLDGLDDRSAAGRSLRGEDGPGAPLGAARTAVPHSPGLGSAELGSSAPGSADLESVDLESADLESGDPAPPPAPLPGGSTLEGPAGSSGPGAAHSADPPPGMPPVPLSRAALAALAGGLERAFVPGPELGRGGVGVVRLARHVLLDREVALKSTNPASNRRAARRGLLREAAATAALAHPNIVPVHDLVVDENGEPHVVLERIQGHTWLEYLLDPARISARHGARDLLGWHLGVLEQVCAAVHHAHGRGILHRDLKPDNVMIGPSGEVYVVDWGLAVRLDETGPARLRLARDDRRIVGTPRFMAPEMARGDGPALGPATDVYLLGALLYAILTGRGPHPGHGVEETLASVPRFVPRFPPAVPPRLAAVVTRAMAAAPADRYPSADAVRLALVAFREQRAALQLVEATRVRHAALDAALAPGAEPLARDALYRRFDEVRFGYQQALQAAPSAAELDEARAGLQAAFARMVAHELDAGDLRAASVLLDQMDPPPDALVGRRAALAARIAADAAQSARDAAQRDPTVGQRTRIFVFSLFMVSWAILPVVGWLGGVALETDRMIALHAGSVLVVLGLVFWARDSLGRSELNRRVRNLLVILQITLLVSDLVGAALGLDPVTVLLWHQLLFAMLAAIAADAIDRRFAWAVPGYLVALGVALVDRSWLLPADGLANLVVGIIGFAIWAPPWDQMRSLFVRDPAERSAGE